VAFDKASYDRTYCAENTTIVRVRLNKKHDADILAHLAKQPNVSGYLKALIRADIQTSR